MHLTKQMIFLHKATYASTLLDLRFKSFCTEHLTMWNVGKAKYMAVYVHNK